MIKFRADRDGEPLYGFGLSDKNLELLRKGKPIHVQLGPMGGVGSVFIFSGPTEQDMADDLQAMGLITPETKVLDQTQNHEGAKDAGSQSQEG